MNNDDLLDAKRLLSLFKAPSYNSKSSSKFTLILELSFKFIIEFKLSYYELDYKL